MTPPRLVVLLLAFLASCPAVADVLAADGPFARWDALDKRISDRTIDRAEARAQLRLLRSEVLASSPTDLDPRRRVFPVRGGMVVDIGGTRGSGYVPDGYDAYDGKDHTGHPAHDIFIHDADQDALDDATKRPVDVVAFTDGVVTAVNRGWKTSSGLRGGNYAWVYSPPLDRLFCYAHLQEVRVDPGAAVRAGDVLGTIGRTGLNAAAKRSPTHLHLVVLDFNDGRLTPFNPYRELIGARRLP